MTAGVIQAGAPTQGEVDWASINWQKVNHAVKRLQARIVKAVEQGRWNKAKALQHLLTHSFSGKAQAVRRVTENQGKNTAGIEWTIRCCCTQPVIDRFTALGYLFYNRVPTKGRSQRLELSALKGARSVLRGLGASNGPRLPDPKATAAKERGPMHREERYERNHLYNRTDRDHTI